MDPWIEQTKAELIKSRADVARWQPIIDMHRWLDEMGALRARCAPAHRHVAAELDRLSRWFRFARDSASVESMRWLELRIELTVAWAGALLDHTPGRCGPHGEPLSLAVCDVCHDVIGVRCGIDCGASGACGRCCGRTAAGSGAPPNVGTVAR